MGIYDLLFILVFLTTVAGLILTISRLIRSRREQAFGLLRRLSVGLAIYLTIVALVSVFAPWRILAMNEDQCFDDWCLAVQQVQAKEDRLMVTVRVSSHARRVSQRAPDASVYLLDEEGRRYEEAAPGTGPSLGSVLSPGASFTSTRVFDVPRGSRNLSLLVRHGGGFPGWFIIGDGGGDGLSLRKGTKIRIV